MTNKFNHLDQILNEVQGKFIRLSDDEIKKNNAILGEVLDIIEESLKKSVLFTQLYRGRFYGGSFYDGLRVGHPSEFDIVFKLALPIELKAKVIHAKEAGFLQVQLYNLHEARKLRSFMNTYGDFLDACVSKKKRMLAAKISSWFKGLVESSLFDYLEGQFYVFNTSMGTIKANRIQESGPALTLKFPNIMDIDLVPCFVFSDNSWPIGYKDNPFPQEPEFFAVPKPVGGFNKWRPSFGIQEQLLIKDLQHLKPIGKLLKQVRDVLKQNKIASYYLKTLLLWKVHKMPEDYWRNSVSFLFMDLLNYYRDCLDLKRIPYYWNDNYNLLGKVGQKYLSNICKRLTKIINEIETNPLSPDGILKCLLDPPERKIFLKYKN